MARGYLTTVSPCRANLTILLMELIGRICRYRCQFLNYYCGEAAMRLVKVLTSALFLSFSFEAGFAQTAVNSVDALNPGEVIADGEGFTGAGEELNYDASGEMYSRVDQCRRFDADPTMCRRYNCEYNVRYRVCVSRQQGPVPPRPMPPQPGPYYCNQFDYNEYQCKLNGCFFDFSTQQCFAQGGGPRPNPPAGRGFMCTAVDAGWEEHRSGHQGIGRTQYEAQQAAMGDCLRHHGECRITRCQRY